jgi:hypothetical protein
LRWCSVLGARGRQVLTTVGAVVTVLQVLCWHAALGAAMSVKGAPRF